MNLWRINKYYFLRLKRLRGSPRALAGGTAIGVFIGLTPTMPLHTILIILLALLTRTSAVAGIIFSWLVCNPLTYLPIYYLSAVIGNHITPYELNLEKVQAILDHVLAAGSFRKVPRGTGSLLDHLDQPQDSCRDQRESGSIAHVLRGD